MAYGKKTSPANAPHRWRRRTDWEPKRGWYRVAAIALLVALTDWATKYMIVRTIGLNDLTVVVDERLALWHVRNPALILGLFGEWELASRKGITFMLGLATVALLIAVVSRSHRLLPARQPWAWLFGGLLAGGLLGNLGERLLHWWVTDFVSLGWNGLWLPPGNIADLAIICSVPVAGLVILFELEARSMRRTRSGRASGSALTGDMRR